MFGSLSDDREFKRLENRVKELEDQLDPLPNRIDKLICVYKEKHCTNPTILALGKDDYNNLLPKMDQSDLKYSSTGFYVNTYKGLITLHDKFNNYEPEVGEI